MMDRICFFRYQPYPWIISLLNAAIETGYTAKFFTFIPYYHQWNNFDNDSIRQYRLFKFLDEFFSVKMLFDMFKARFDIIVMQDPGDIMTLFAGVICWFRHSKLVIFYEQNVETPKANYNFFVIPYKLFRNFISKLVKNFVSLLVVPSSKAYDYAVLKGFNPDKIVIQPHAVALNLFKPLKKSKAFLKKLGLSDNDFVVLFNGVLAEHKGIAYLLDAAEKLKDIFFVLPSFGPRESLVKKRISSDGLSNVKLVDYVDIDELPEYYSIADIVILPSIVTTVAEQSPNCINEAMACGKPVIATNIGGIPSILDGEGVLIPQKNTNIIINTIKKLKRNKALMRKMGRSARKSAVKRFDPMVYLDNMLNALK